MNREEILEKSRLENKKFDERETGIRFDAKRFGMYAGFIVLLGIWVYHILVLHDYAMQTEVFMIISSTVVVECGCLYAKLKRKNDLIFAVIGSLIFILNLLVLVGVI